MITTETSTEMVHRCLSCGRPIRSAESIAIGRGSGCRAKIRRAAREADLSQWTPAQAESAREAIEDGAIVASGRPGEYLVVSSDGAEVYATTEATCSCPAGVRDKLCWHRCVAVIVIAASAPASPIVQPLGLAA